MFSLRRFRHIAKPNATQKTAFGLSFGFIDVALLKASATESFANGLFCVCTFSSLAIVHSVNKSCKLFTFLNRLEVLPTRPRASQYSNLELRYLLRMRPFMQVSLPEIPSFAEFSSLEACLETADEESAQHTEQSLSQLKSAEQAMNIARKEWEAISKLDAETARCVGCEKWWRTSVKDAIRACIACNIAIATTKKGLLKAEGRNMKDVLQVEVTESEKSYHPFWTVPKVVLKI